MIGGRASRSTTQSKQELVEVNPSATDGSNRKLSDITIICDKLCIYPLTSLNFRRRLSRQLMLSSETLNLLYIAQTATLAPNGSLDLGLMRFGINGKIRLKIRLVCKQGLFTGKRSLVCNAKKPCSWCKQGFFGNGFVKCWVQHCNSLAYNTSYDFATFMWSWCFFMYSMLCCLSVAMSSGWVTNRCNASYTLS